MSGLLTRALSAGRRLAGLPGDGLRAGAAAALRRWRRRRPAGCWGAALALSCLASSPAAAIEESLLRELRAGAVLLMRHTQTTPGVGDPPGWRLADCGSQRNLSAEGIEQARAIGRWFQAQGLRPQVVRHSPWCRTRDTAQLAFGQGEPWPALSNIFEDRRFADPQAAEVRRYIGALEPGQLVVLVSHGVTIAHIVPEAAGLAVGEAAVVRAGASPQDPPLLLGRLRWP